jgi:hypothetical protein
MGNYNTESPQKSNSIGTTAFLQFPSQQRCWGGIGKGPASSHMRWFVPSGVEINAADDAEIGTNIPIQCATRS